MRRKVVVQTFQENPPYDLSCQYSELAAGNALVTRLRITLGFPSSLLDWRASRSSPQAIPVIPNPSDQWDVIREDDNTSRRYHGVVNIPE
ncbi:hypothetical protein SK128_016904 [Halocaridina rubra]|uniref:Uncharacterized protein n=1 Tax=Halocaridina rubra TaxID=373956 RepID=A0AAN9A862_HALRR